MLGVILDRAPQHENKEVDQFLKENTEWSCIAFVPGGLTSIKQAGDLVANADLKLMIKSLYEEWKIDAIKKLQGYLKKPSVISI